SKRGAPLNALWSSSAAVSARATFATSAKTTHDTDHCGQCTAKCASAATAMYHFQRRRGDSVSAAVSAAYGGNRMPAPVAGYRNSDPTALPMSARMANSTSPGAKPIGSATALPEVLARCGLIQLPAEERGSSWFGPNRKS